uniref:NADH-ubiquinone oxidoreductase chain 3 n=1 Tax=Pronodularia japanensis TaxID=1835347 RepID=Q94QP5_9BIVA|nr:NADH dehydrogenase complex 3 [Pronodularia japanensis]
MKMVIACGVFSVLVSVAMMGLGWVLSGRYLWGVRELSSPFECGFDPVGSSRVGFSLRFFGLMILFIVFDFETVLLLPFVFWSGMGLDKGLGVVEFVGFLVILLVGVVYEMKEGALEWGF